MLQQYLKISILEQDRVGNPTFSIPKSLSLIIGKNCLKCLQSEDNMGVAESCYGDGSSRMQT